MNKFDQFKNKKILITQIRSVAGTDKKIQSTVKGLGLRKIGDTFKTECSNSILGMIKKISYLIKVEELKK
jgi:large subunit ribosomal protein L30